MSSPCGGRSVATGPRHPDWLWKLGEPATGGLLLCRALQNGYSPCLSSLAYLLPGRGASLVERRAWMVQTAYAMAPDLLIRVLTTDPNQLELPYGRTPYAAKALASVLSAVDSPLHEPASSAWARAARLLAAIDPMTTLTVKLAVLGNPQPLITRYNEVQPVVRLHLNSSS